MLALKMLKDQVYSVRALATCFVILVFDSVSGKLDVADFADFFQALLGKPGKLLKSQFQEQFVAACNSSLVR